MRPTRLLAAALTAIALAATAAPAHAQGSLLKRLKDDAKKRASAAATQAGTKVVEHTGAATDTVLQKGVDGVDSASGRTTDRFAATLGRAQTRLPGFLGGRKPGAVPNGTPLAPEPPHATTPGTTAPTPPDRAVLTDVSLDATADTLVGGSLPYLRDAAKVLADDGGAWTLEVTVAPAAMPNAARDRARAARRAEAVRAALVAAGVSAGRLTAVGRVAAAGDSAAVVIARSTRAATSAR
jgi:hypothetical protein